MISEGDESKEHFWRVNNPLVWGVAGTSAILAFGLFAATRKDCYFGLEAEALLCETKFVALLNASPNEIGDTLAGFAGALAFLWIVVTVFIQSHELRAQKKELAETREELKLAREAQQDQVKAFKDQRFEVAFFEMLSQHREIVRDLSYTYGGTAGQGAQAFSACRAILISKINKYVGAMEELSSVKGAYEDFWKRGNVALGHYFRFLFNFFRFLDENENSLPFHSKLLRSQISDDELFLLFYNCLSDRGRPFVEYALKFELFNNLDPSHLAQEDHAALLPIEVFGVQEASHSE